MAKTLLADLALTTYTSRHGGPAVDCRLSKRSHSSILELHQTHSISGSIDQRGLVPGVLARALVTRVGSSSFAQVMLGTVILASHIL